MAQVQTFFNRVFEKHTDVELGNVNVIVLLVLQNSSYCSCLSCFHAVGNFSKNVKVTTLMFLCLVF